jgi:serine/threonine protein kinase/tetratricopeptide (TPR) repeat protein
MKPGQVLAGRFRLEHKIGEGGIGVVFEATDVRTQQACAIKLLRPRYASDPRIRRRFMREARAVGRLRHPKIVRLLTYGDAEGMPFLAMELLQGESLTAFAARTTDLEALLEVVDQCLEALAYSHARGVIHRDFKPDNVLLVGLSVKLLDFGFARVEEDDDPDLTQVHRDAFGTADYMAPEQASGDGPIGPATDLYAVGAVLFELLSGQPPFSGRSPMDIVLKQMSQPPPPLVAKPGLVLPEGLEAVVRQALAKAPRARFASANDLRRRLAVFWAEAGAVRDRPPSTVVGSFEDDTTLVGASVEAVLGPVDRVVPSVVGRDLEMAWLWDRVRAVCDSGQGRAVLLGSLPGMGRGVLAGWLRDLVVEGGWMRVARGLIGPDPHHGHGDLREMVEQLFGGLPSGRDAVESMLRQVAERWNRLGPSPQTGVALEDTLSAVGALAEYLRPRASTPVLGGAVLFERICDAIRLASGERPVLLTLEEIDQAGPVMRDFLAHMASEVSGLPVLVVATYTLDERDRPVGAARAALAELAVAEGVEAIVLDPLDDDAIIELLEDAAPMDPLLAQRIADVVAGNPLFAVELLATLRQAGEIIDLAGVLVSGNLQVPVVWPTTLSDALVARIRGTLSRLPDGAFVEQVLLRAAVLGPVFDYGLLRDYLARAGVPAQRAEQAIEALLQANLLAEDRDRRADRLHFPHAAVVVAAQRVAEETGLPVPLLHRLAAEAKEAWFGNRRAPVVGELALHFQQAEAPLRAAACYAEAAAFARTAGEVGHGLALLAQGLALLADQHSAEAMRRQAGLRLDLAEAELQRGGAERSRALVQQAEKWARDAGDEATLARVRHLLADMLVHLERFTDAAKWYRSAVGQYDRAEEAEGRARALLGLARVLRTLHGDDAVHDPLVAQAWVDARDAYVALGDVAGAAPAWLGLGELASARGAPAEAREALELALEGFRAQGDWSARARCHLRLSDVCAQLDASSLVEAHLDEALTAFAGLGDHAGLACTHARLAQLHAEHRAWAAAMAHLDQAVASWTTLERPGSAIEVRIAVGRLALDAGAAAIARQVLEAALEEASALTEASVLGDHRAQTVLCALVGWAAALQDDSVAFRAYFQRAWVLEKTEPVVDLALAQAYGAAGRQAMRLGDSGAASHLFARASELHGVLGNPADAERLRHASEASARIVAAHRASTPPQPRHAPTPVTGSPAAWAAIGRESRINVALPLPGMESPAPVLRADLAHEEYESLDDRMGDLDLADLASVNAPTPVFAGDDSVELHPFESDALQDPDDSLDWTPPDPVEVPEQPKASSNAPSSDGAIGQHIGNLEIVERIAVGGMGAVYKARHMALGTPYAIKLLHPSFSADHNTIARFRREAVACSRLRHPNVVFLTDFGLDETLGIYLVMEFLEGLSLAERLNRDRSLPVGEALQVAEAVSQALGAAHALGIVHRDLKPENIFLVDDGDGGHHVKVLDFGIARLRTEDGERLTGAGLVLGTPDYMSPEQISGNDELVGPTTDIYALGVLIYEMVTGGPPFTGSNDFQVLSRHLLDAVPRLGVRRVDLADTALEALMVELLAKAPEDRPSNMALVRDRMDAALEELQQLGVEDLLPVRLTQAPAAPEPVVPRLTQRIDEIRRSAPQSNLGLVLEGLPALVALPPSLAQQVLWGVLSRTLLDTGTQMKAFADACGHLRLMVEAALELGTRPDGGAILLTATACLTDLMAIADPARQKAMVLALHPLRSVPRFPEKALPNWARVTSSGTWQARPIPGRAARASSKPSAQMQALIPSPMVLPLDDGLPAEGSVGTDSLVAKLGRPVSLKSIKSVLSHEFSLFGRRDPSKPEG